jgi:hypothetical protein
MMTTSDFERDVSLARSYSALGKHPVEGLGRDADPHSRLQSLAGIHLGDPHLLRERVFIQMRAAIFQGARRIEKTYDWRLSTTSPRVGIA